MMGVILEEKINELKNDMLVLVEAFHIPDMILKSDIGHSNGTPYDNLYNTAKQTGLLNNNIELQDYLVKNLVPFMKRKGVAPERPSL
jgi:hypothetical protein